jgi:hypothetical protein
MVYAVGTGHLQLINVCDTQRTEVFILQVVETTDKYS